MASVCLSVSNVSSKKLEKSYRNIDKGNEIEKRSVQTVVRPDDPAKVCRSLDGIRPSDNDDDDVAADDDDGDKDDGLSLLSQEICAVFWHFLAMAVMIW